MSLPRKVQVLSRLYTIRRVSKATLEREYGQETFGDCCPQDCRIRVAQGMSREAARGVLEHELGHAFIFELGLKPALDDAGNDLEEHIVEKLLPAWLGAVRPRRRRT